MIELFYFYAEHALRILTVLWILAVTRSILFWLNYIQLKQYRLDRIIVELKQVGFYKLVFSTYRSILIGFFVAWQVLLRTSVSSQFGAFDWLLTAIILFFAFHGYKTVRHLATRTLQIPVFTKKIWLIFIFILILEIWIASTYQFWPEQLLAIEVIQPFIVLFIFFILFIPNYLMQRRLMSQAREKRRALTDLQVIGITGSYGKTSMKEYLSHILSQKYSVLKTPNHVNVDTGIAKLVLDELNESHDIFIVEMGAYRQFEIRRICDIVQPQFGVMTGLGDQHLELFGSKKKIEQTKFELVDAVRENEHLFANAESEILMSAFKSRGIKPVSYGFENGANYSGKIISTDDGMTTFTVGDTKFSVPIFGRALIINLLGAISVAKKLGMNMKEISGALHTLPTIQRTMQPLNGPNDSLFIDDSFNANTDGVLAALRDLSESKKEKKIVIFKEIIELGDASADDHRRIAEAMVQTVDYVMFLPGQETLAMRKQMTKNGFSDQHFLHHTDKEKLRELLDDKTIVLFEGRGSEQLLLSLTV